MSLAAEITKCTSHSIIRLMLIKKNNLLLLSTDFGGRTSKIQQDLTRVSRPLSLRLCLQRCSCLKMYEIFWRYHWFYHTWCIYYKTYLELPYGGGSSIVLRQTSPKALILTGHQNKNYRCL